MTREGLTLLSTTCIVASGVSLLIGWWLIRARRAVDAHRAAMLIATVLAGLFLVAYVTRWATFGTKVFAGSGTWRAIYLGILAPHVVLAAIVGPLALRQIQLARRRAFPAHRRLGRVLVPMWAFVAGSGWVVYWMLYRMTF
jgi:putative membrane protein